jgi:hypothetical protein
MIDLGLKFDFSTGVQKGISDTFSPCQIQRSLSNAADMNIAKGATAFNPIRFEPGRWGSI